MNKLDIKVLKNSRSFFENKPSGANYILVGVVGLTLLFLLVWSSIAEMDDIVKSEIIIRPAGTISSVTSLAGGKLLRKNWSQGGVVKTGDLLWEVEALPVKTELENTRKQFRQNGSDLEDLRILKQCMENDTTIGNIIGRPIYQRWASFSAEKSRLQLQLVQTAEELTREESLPSNMSTPQQIKDKRASYDQLKASFAYWASNQIVSVSGEIKELESTRRNLENNLAEIEKKLKDTAVFAPISGRIAEIRKLNPGDTMMAGDEILRIIPEGAAAVKAELLITPTDIARVRQGQVVHIRFPKLPASDFGQIKAVISVVPPDVIQKSDGQSYFVIEALISDPMLKSTDGEQVLLRPGMVGEGRIILKRNTILRMVLQQLDYIQ